MDEAVSRRRNVITGYVKAILFGISAGIFAVIIDRVMYSLWMAVFFNIVSEEHLIVTGLTIAGYQVHAVLISIPVMAGALFAMSSYVKGNLTGLFIENALAAAIMATIFFIAAPAYYNPSPLDLFIYSLNPYSGMMMPGNMVAGMTTSFIIALAMFLIWATAGAFIAYLFISKALVRRKPKSTKRLGIISLALVSLVAIVPPAAAYVAFAF